MINQGKTFSQESVKDRIGEKNNSEGYHSPPPSPTVPWNGDQKNKGTKIA